MILKRTALFSTVTFGFFSVAYASDAYNNFVGQYFSFNAGATYAYKIYQSRSKSGILGAGGNLFFGDQINAYFAPEVGFGYFSFGSNGGVTLLSLNGRFTLPVGTNVSLFVKLGAGYGEVITRIDPARKTTNDFVPSLGAGIGVGFLPNWMATLEANGAYFPYSLGNANGPIGGITLGVTHYFSY